MEGGKLSMSGHGGGWFGSRNLFLHEMALGVCVLQSFRPPPGPLVLLQLSRCLPLTGSWWGSPFSWGDCLSLLSWLSHRLKEQGSW